MPRVRIKNGMAKGAVYEIGDAPLTIGRDTGCNIQVMDKGASRNHSQIFRIGEMCFVRDLGSRNGTLVNDQPVEEELLREGDRIMVGSTVLVFESAEDSVSTDESGVEFTNEAEDSFDQTLSLRLEDLTDINVSGPSDGSESKRLRAIYRLGRILAEEYDQGTLLQKVLEFCASTIGSDSAYLFTPDPQKGVIVPLGCYTAPNKKSGRVSRTIIRRSLQEKRAILTSDAMQDSRFSSNESILIKQIKSVICVPLSTVGDVGGVLYLSTDSPQQVFTEEDLELVAAMADMCGLAMGYRRVRAEQREAHLSAIRAMLRASEMRAPSLRGHSDRVATYAVAIAKQMSLPENERETLQLAALLHDVGRLVTEGSGPEADRLRQSATIEIVSEMANAEALVATIKNMREHFDGQGAKGMAGDQIPQTARILAVALEFEVRANISGSGIKPQEALRRAAMTISEGAGKQFDPEVVKAMLIAHRNGAFFATPLERIAKENSEEK